MADICPTITAYDAHEFRLQMERVESFAKRIHIDLMDGKFAPTTSPALETVWWPSGLTADIHLMYQQVEDQISALIKLRPNLVIVHAEVGDSNNLPLFFDQLKSVGIKAGLALLPATSIDKIQALLPELDHVLVFSGNLGYHGGTADLGLLDKVKQLRAFKPSLEISWDGGINEQNAKTLVEAGVDVLNVGGYIQKAPDPQGVYKNLITLLQS